MVVVIINYFGVAVLCVYLLAMVVMTVMTVLVSDVLSWLCALFGVADAVVVLVACLMLLCDYLPNDAARGKVIEYYFVAEFGSSQDRDGVQIYTYKNRNSGRWQYLPADAVIVENDNPSVVVKYELIEYKGTEKFYCDKRYGGVQFVFE